MIKYARGEIMKQFIANDWWPVLEPEFEKPYYQELRRFFWLLSIISTKFIQLCNISFKRLSGHPLVKQR